MSDHILHILVGDSPAVKSSSSCSLHPLVGATVGWVSCGMGSGSGARRILADPKVIPRLPGVLRLFKRARRAVSCIETFLGGNGLSVVTKNGHCSVYSDVVGVWADA